MKIAIYGYGNLGRGVESCVPYNDDMELVGVFTRRDPETVKTQTGVPVFPSENVLKFKDQIDVLILCGGSATDLPQMTPALAKDFNVVDSFDTHANIPQHFAAVDQAAKDGGYLAAISCGWDPGMFSVNRVYMESILRKGASYTFWGRGVSQGHSDAIRRIEGVVDARQYTVPVPEAVERVRRGENPLLTTRMKHTRECYVAVSEGADKEAIEKTIKEMPHYFDEYDTTVHFVSLEELKKNHTALPHGGSVIRSGKTGLHEENTHTMEFDLTLDSNPEFTASILVACARAVCRKAAKGQTGCITMLDMAPSELSPFSGEELRAHSL